MLSETALPRLTELHKNLEGYGAVKLRQNDEAHLRKL